MEDIKIGDYVMLDIGDKEKPHYGWSSDDSDKRDRKGVALVKSVEEYDSILIDFPHYRGFFAKPSELINVSEFMSSLPAKEKNETLSSEAILLANKSQGSFVFLPNVKIEEKGLIKISGTFEIKYSLPDMTDGSEIYKLAKQKQEEEGT